MSKIWKCAECGNIWAGNTYETCPQCGGGTGYYEEPPIEDLQTAAEQGDAQAQYELGVLNIFDTPRWYSPWNHDPSGPLWFYDFFLSEGSIEWFLEAAEQGHAGAQYELGKMYYEYAYTSAGEDDYPDKAFAVLSKAAEQDHVAAQVWLGRCYQEGVGVEANEEEAFKWFSKAAESEYPAALIELGKCYEKGEGVEKDVVKAVECYRTAADNGDDEAEYELGKCYLDGIGVRRNPYEALWWFTGASFRNESASDAREELCQSDCLKDHDADFNELHDTFESAEYGDAESQYWMGYWYEHATFDECDEDEDEDDDYSIDLTEAEYWYGKAAEQGYKEAEEALKRLKK